MMTLEPHGPDTFVGQGPQYPWGGLYGGQIVAQALRAAAETVDPAFGVHSLHAFFIRPGDHDLPVRYEVDRLRDGRSFATRTVVARQPSGAIFNMAASFQVDEAGPAVQTAVPPEVPGPDELTSDGWSPMFERRLHVPADQPGRAFGWLRLAGSVGDDPVLGACALAYLSDDLPTDAVVGLHPTKAEPDRFDETFVSASLDHAIWFHRPMPPDAWQLQNFICHGLGSSRALSVGHVFTEAGTHVATITQEVLIRQRR